MSQQRPASEASILRQFSSVTGDFIRYWGFRRIHGEIWAQVYLSKAALSGTQIAENLGVSKALVSPALSELESHGLIKPVPLDGKTVTYMPCDDILSVIGKILLTREQPMIDQAAHLAEKLQATAERSIDSTIAIDRLDALKPLLEISQLAIRVIAAQFSNEDLTPLQKSARTLKAIVN